MSKTQDNTTIVVTKNVHGELAEIRKQRTVANGGNSITFSQAILYLIDFYRQNGIERDEFADVIETLNRNGRRED